MRRPGGQFFHLFFFPQYITHLQALYERLSFYFNVFLFIPPVPRVTVGEQRLSDVPRAAGDSVAEQMLEPSHPSSSLVLAPADRASYPSGLSCSCKATLNSSS